MKQLPASGESVLNFFVDKTIFMTSIEMRQIRKFLPKCQMSSGPHETILLNMKLNNE